jgi:hypothetical protein
MRNQRKDLWEIVYEDQIIFLEKVEKWIVDD